MWIKLTFVYPNWAELNIVQTQVVVLCGSLYRF